MHRHRLLRLNLWLQRSPAISHSENRQDGKSGETAKEIGGQRHISHINVILSPIDKD
jgi:hypothetical protein